MSEACGDLADFLLFRVDCPVVPDPSIPVTLAGQLLVASPRLADPLFGRSVCLVMHHDSSGAIGVLLNRPLEVGDQFWKLLKHQPAADSRLEPQGSESQGPAGWVHFGGPLSGPLVALHCNRQLAEAEPSQGVYLAAQKEHLEQLVRSRAGTPLRLIVGHAGWSAGKLEAELAAGFWYPVPATVERVFEADDAMWGQLVRTGVGATLARWVGLDATGFDPTRN